VLGLYGQLDVAADPLRLPPAYMLVCQRTAGGERIQSVGSAVDFMDVIACIRNNCKRDSLVAISADMAPWDS